MLSAAEPPNWSGRALRLLTGQDKIRRAIYVIGSLPAVWLFWRATNDQLGADPVRTLERTLGLDALRFLAAGLAITPLRRLGGPNLVRYRRAIGLLAFFYATLHLFAYLVFDQNLDASAILKDIVKRPYITIGFAAFVILVPLAITSNNAMIRRIGPVVWNKLHRWVYVAAALGATHFLMLVKSWPPEPVIYASIIATLLAFRLYVYIDKRRERARRAA